LGKGRRGQAAKNGAGQKQAAHPLGVNRVAENHAFPAYVADAAPLPE
jgi:hypothetical protein